MTTRIAELENELQQTLGRQVFGLEDIIHFLLIALVARGHILLQGSPGIGKTLLSKSLAQVLGGEFRRIQGTADLMPSDITGVNIFDESRRQFVFQKGPLFADVVLFDEINRAGPKTQSALLEAMEERQITADGESYTLSNDFLVVATQNPFEFEGTYPLPESELDRFLLMLDMDYPDREAEERVLSQYAALSRPADSQTRPTLQIDAATIAGIRAEVDSVHLSPELIAYILDIARATRESERLSLGVSTRGLLALTKCARIEAAMRGGDYVIPDDVKRVAAPVIGHRIVLTPEAVLENLDAQTYAMQLVDNVAVPR
jgi:MoxR-like ATPase